MQILSSVGEAHAAGILHRDLKPSNVIVTRRDGRDHLVVVDFGLAKMFDDGLDSLSDEAPLTGSPRYVSPEMVLGSPMGPHSDLYSAGILFHEVLTGAPPYDGESPLRTALMHLNEPPPRLPAELDVPQALRDALSRMVAKDPAVRAGSASVLLEVLGPLAGDGG